jgi:O-antigen/teichoic acid export membrane protein
MQEIKKSFWDLIAVTGSIIFSIPLMIISESIQARYLGPALYGKVALIMSVINLSYLFGMSWLKRAIVRFGKEELIQENHIRKTITQLFILNAISFIVISLILYSTKKSIFHFVEIQQEFTFFIIIAGLLLSVLNQSLFEILIVFRLIKLQSFLSRIFNKLIILIGLLFLLIIIKNLNIYNVIMVLLFSEFIAIISCFFFLKSQYFFPFLFDKVHFKKIFLFSFPLIFSGWSTYVINWIDIYAIKYYMTLDDVGIYQAAYKIFSTLKSFWGIGLVTITMPIIVVFKTNKQLDKIKNIYLQRFLPQLCFISMITLALIILFSDYAFHLIYGNRYMSAVLPFKILTASQSFSVITYTLLAVIFAFDWTKMMLYIGIFTAVLNITLDIVLVPYLGIVGPAIASSVVFTLGPIIWFHYVNKKITFNSYISFLFPIMTLLIMFINISELSIYLKSIISVLILFSSYLIAREYNLFHKNDIQTLNNINMPIFVKNSFIKIILFLSK